MKKIVPPLLMLLLLAVSFGSLAAKQWERPNLGTELHEQVQKLLGDAVDSRPGAGLLEVKFRVDRDNRMEILSVRGGDEQEVRNRLAHVRLSVDPSLHGQVLQLAFRTGSQGLRGRPERKSFD